MESNKEKILERNQKIIALHDSLAMNINRIYDLWIRESSNSRRTNLKRLNGWKLIKVTDIQYRTYARDEDEASFWVKIESTKGKHKSLIGEDVVKYILKK